MKFFSKLFSAAMLTAFPVLCVAFALWFILIWKKPHANYGMDFLPTIWPISVCLLLAIYQLFRKKKLAFLVPLCINFLAILFFAGVDRFNIMLEYGRWAFRGMPGRFEKTILWSREQIEERDKDIIKIYDTNGRLRMMIRPPKQEEPDE
jgi:hypothetical protein